MKAKLLTPRAGIDFSQEAGQEIEVQEGEFLRMYVAGQCEPACDDSRKCVKDKAVQAEKAPRAPAPAVPLLAGQKENEARLRRHGEARLRRKGRRRGRTTAVDEQRETTDEVESPDADAAIADALSEGEDALEGEQDPDQD